MWDGRVAEPVGYHLSFEDGRDDPDGRQLPPLPDDGVLFQVTPQKRQEGK